MEAVLTSAKKTIVIRAAATLFLVFATLCVAAKSSSSTSAQPETSDLQPFHFVADILPGFALDVSFLFHRPVGSKGFVTRDGENLRFSNSDPTRFWGVNISWDALYPPEEEVETVAKCLSPCSASSSSV